MYSPGNKAELMRDRNRGSGGGSVVWRLLRRRKCLFGSWLLSAFLIVYGIYAYIAEIRYAGNFFYKVGGLQSVELSPGKLGFPVIGRVDFPGAGK